MLPIRTILHPTDFSESSDVAFRVASSLARDYGARLVALHVAPRDLVDSRVIGGPTTNFYRESIARRLEQLQMPDLRVRVEHRLREGDVVAEILLAADETRSDLIVMGTHGRSGLGRALMGSVAEAVLRRARCPVLTVKSPLSETGPASGEPSQPAMTSS